MTNTNGDRDNDLEAVKQNFVYRLGNMSNWKLRMSATDARIDWWRKGKTVHKTEEFNQKIDIGSSVTISHSLW